MTTATVDNDVLIKLSAYCLLRELVSLLGGDEQVAVLGAARFVVPRRLERHEGIVDTSSALAEWRAALQLVEELEPSDEEVQLATVIEDAAARAGVQVDGGESQLCAISIRRGVPLLVTGDKRAIEGLELLVEPVCDLEDLAGRVMCLEQVALAMVEACGATEVRAHVCGEPRADKAMAVCFSCSSLADGSTFDDAGLHAYIENVRAVAPRLLAPEMSLDQFFRNTA